MKLFVRPVARLGVAALLAAVSIVSTCGVASASPPFYVFHNVMMHDCLDDSVIGLRPFVCNGLPYQTWMATTTHDISNTYFVRNEATKLCLDDSVIGLRAIECNFTTYQKWFFNEAYGQVENEATGNCMQESSWGKLRMEPCGDNDNYENWDGGFFPW